MAESTNDDQPKSKYPQFSLSTYIPLIGCLLNYQATWLRSDIVAGVTLAAYGIPVSLAYASLAGLPPHHGIYCYLVAGLAYALMGTSRQLAIGPTSAIAMLVGVSVAGMAEGDPQRHAVIAALAALLVAVIAAIAWFLKLSGIVSFISETILTGFKAGAALTIGLTQVPKLFGVPGGGDHFFERLWILAKQLPDTNKTKLALGLIAIILLVLGNRFLPGRPTALAVVILAIVVVTLGELTKQGVAVVGTIPAGLPGFSWPSLRAKDVDGLIPLAAACFLLAYVEGISAARALAEKHGDEIDPRQELLALGAANGVVAFVQGFPVAGGLSQSAVNDKAGAKTPLSLVFASASIGFCLLFLTGLLQNLPTVVLAAIVLVAVRGLIDLPALQHLWRVSRFEFKITMVAFIGVLLLGILKGVLLAMVVSILMLLAAGASPHVAVLGRIRGTNRYSDQKRHPDNELIPRVFIFRVESALLYFNVEHIRNVVRGHLATVPHLGLVVCDLSNASYVDVAGAKLLHGLHQELAPREIPFRIVEARSRVRDILRAEGMEEQIGYFGRHLSLDDLIREYEKDHPQTPTSSLPTH